MKIFKKILSVFCAITVLTGIMTIGVAAAPEDYTHYSGVVKVTNKNGLVLAYHKDSGVKILSDEASGYYFKDLNKNNQLDPYEDWRLSTNARVANLLSLMTTDKKLALKSHARIDAATGFRFSVSRASGKATAAETNNNSQKLCEAVDWGIPAVNSSDPRHSGVIDSGWNPWDATDLSISRWPNTMGMSNSFDKETFTKFGDILAAEYRGMGIQMQLGPQMDYITDPRWSRNSSCISEDSQLNEDLTNAMITAMQASNQAPIADYGIDAGWGPDSVAAMAKHWPSSGAGEFGYEGHVDLGKFAVYPGDNFTNMMNSFNKAAGIGAGVEASTSQVAAVMPMFSVAWGQNPSGQNVATGFSKWMLTDLLKGAYDFGGMTCADWNITVDKCWGVEAAKGYTQTYRVCLSYLAGMDQLGNFGTLSIMQDAYNMAINGSTEFGIPAYGQEAVDAMLNESAGRILKVIFNLGLFENPYSDPDYANETVGSSEFAETGFFEGHLKSIVMLKNSNNVLPLDDETSTAYVPQLKAANGTYSFPLAASMVANYYDVPDAVLNAGSSGIADKQAAANESDFAIVWLNGPSNGNGTANRAQTCQFAPYTVTDGREVSIGGDWYHANGTLVQYNEVPNPAAGDYLSNRSVRGLTNPGTQNYLDMLMETKALMGDKPVIAILDYKTPTVPEEFEPYVDAIVASSSCTPAAYLWAISGAYEPTGLLSVSFPANMKAVEEQCEDLSHDMVNYVDADGNEYAFGFGLNYEGRIVDTRTEEYIGLSAEPYKLISAPTEVTAGVNFSFKIAAPSNVVGIKLVNEQGKAITISGASIESAEYTNYWNLTTMIGTAGNRKITVLAKQLGGQYQETGIVLDLSVIKATSTTGTLAKVNSAAFASSRVFKNATVKFTVKTNTLATKVGVFNENDALMGKTLISKSVANGVITWEFEMSIGSRGLRNFTVAAAKSDGVYNTGAVKLMSIEVL